MRTYKNELGTRVPSVTSVLSILNKPSLIHWAWELGKRGEDYRKVRDNFADIGTLVHKMILDYYKKEKGIYREYSRDQIDLAENCLISFYEWDKNKNYKIIYVERTIVSDKFGGTVDLVVEDTDKKIKVIDFKTGKGLYAEYEYQLGGYSLLLKESGIEVSSGILVNIGRGENDLFTEKEISLNNNEEIFKTCLRLYELINKYEKGG